MKEEKSCGTITIKDNKVLMVKQKNSGNYNFPKGHRKNKEEEIETEIKKKKKEIKINVKKVNNHRYSMTYPINDETIKEVVYFVATTNDANNIVKQESEITEVIWINIDKVIDYIVYDDLKKLWIRAYQDIKKLNLS